MTEPVVIVSPDCDEHARAVAARLEADGVPVRLFDTTAFPTHMHVTLHERGDVVIDGETLRPARVYVRDLGLNPLGQHADRNRIVQAALHERATVVMSIVHRWELVGIPMFNPLSAFARITKPYQLALLAAAGLPVPQTRWTNDPAVVREFAATRAAIYKPVAGGAETRTLEPRDLSDARLERLRAAPVCFQEHLPGRDLRVYVLDGEVIAAIAIVADAVDFRGHELAMEQVTLDETTRQLCVRAASVLGLRFTGMDLKADAAGDLKILELNPSPMFLGFDARSGSDILGALCRALASSVGLR